MKKNLMLITVIAGFIFITNQAFANHGHNNHGNNGIRLATQIVGLVKTVVTPSVIVAPQPVYPAYHTPVVVTPVTQPVYYNPVVVTPAPVYHTPVRVIQPTYVVPRVAPAPVVVPVQNNNRRNDGRVR